MSRNYIIISFLFLLVSYPSFPVQAKLRQSDWAYTVSSQSQSTKVQLQAQLRKWKGVRYQWGGNGFGGIDCSALMQKIYSAVLKRRLPRTTGEQIMEGHPVYVSQLQPGDLVFFKPKKSVRHVGIYMGNHQFMHASGSQGVTLSSLQNPFWISHFETARRVTG